jgi:cysteine desulfurase/selenocysteine lyase
MNRALLLRSHFPLLRRAVNGYPITYLDNAATALKPQAVLDAIVNFYSKQGANIHRGIYTLAEEATQLYEDARRTVAEFIGADSDEIVFTKGATESINAVVSTWAFDMLNAGDQVVVTAMEHHANFVPWQQCVARTGAHLTVVPVNNDGTLCLDNLRSVLGNRTKIIAACHVSNVLGTHNDIPSIVQAAHAVGAKVLVDAAQSVPHQKIDVKKLGCDFLVFSGHKLMGPTGIGVLYAKKEILAAMRPYQYGGGMVSRVWAPGSTWADLPQRFEAGTPPIAAALGLAEAIKYMKKHIDFDSLQIHEAALCKSLIEGLSALKNVKIYGPVDQLQEKGHIVSFNIQGFHPHDVASYCDRFGICIRAGLHCAHPLAEQLGIGPSVRISMFAYNTHQEIEFLLNTLECMIGEMEKCNFI